MSVKTNSNADPSTENANWGTLVILVVLAAVAVFIGVALYSDSQKPTAPITLTAPASAVTPSAPPPASPGSPAVTNGTSPATPPPGGAGGGQ